MWNDPVVQRGLSGSGVVPRTPTFKDKILGFMESALFHVIITLKEGGAFMGVCNIWLEGDNTKNRDGRFAISLTPEYWNMGYATEALKFVVDYAFRWLALHRVSLGVFESNKGAITLYQKV
jgi:RimJ/RimL family protein N-acetyltransferase